MQARRGPRTAAEQDWTPSTSALRLGYHMANVCGTRFRERLPTPVPKFLDLLVD
jgi:hypothetical protein